MKLGEKLYEGKAKILYATEDPLLVIQYFKDDATAFNAQKRGTIMDKGVCNNKISAALFTFLEGRGIKTHFVKQLDERGMLVRRVEIVPLEVTIRTDPAGATVYLNDQIKGESPVTFDFMWYGWHRIILRKEGFERIEDRKLIRAPLYLWIPFDFGMELLPFTVKDQRTFAYTLTPAQSPPIPQPPPPQSPEESNEAR